jgi:methionine-S-sulfoxide reductase
MESPFENLPGVVSIVSGYTGGHVRNPTYDQVCSGKTGHAEAVEVVFDPSRISYEELLDAFWRNIDPTDAGGQFVDRGSQYRTAIFYHGEEQKKAAEESLVKLERTMSLPGRIVTSIVPASEFWPAEEHHQGFYRKNAFRYECYRAGSGRDRRLRDLWGVK